MILNSNEKKEEILFILKSFNNKILDITQLPIIYLHCIIRFFNLKKLYYYSIKNSYLNIIFLI